METKSKGTYKIVNEENDWPHWGWAIMWLILFWPALFLWGAIGVSRKKYRVITTVDGVQDLRTVTKEELEEICFNMEDVK